MTMSVCIWGLFSFIVHLFLRRRRFFWEAPSQNDSEAYISKVVSVLWCADIRYIRYNSFLRFWSIHAITYSFWAFMPVYLFWFFLSNVTHGNECWLLLISAGWCWLMLTLESTFESTFCEHSSQDSTLQSTLVLDKLGPGQLGPTVYFFGLNLPRTLYPENFREHSKEHSWEHFRDHSKNMSDRTNVPWTCCALSLDAIASLWHLSLSVSGWVSEW